MNLANTMIYKHLQELQMINLLIGRSLTGSQTIHTQDNVNIARKNSGPEIPAKGEKLLEAESVSSSTSRSNFVSEGEKVFSAVHVAGCVQPVCDQSSFGGRWHVRSNVTTFRRELCNEGSWSVLLISE